MLEFIKYRIVIFLVLSAITGYVLNYGWKDPIYLLPLAFSVFLACSGASAFNNIFDRDIDSKMKRTQHRLLVSGQIQLIHAILVAVLMLAAGIGMAFYFFNLLVSINLILGAITYVAIYTMWLKRRTWTSVEVGGLAGSFVLLAGASCYGMPNLAAILFSFIIFVWTPCHFWSLSIVNEQDYKEANIPMLPCVIGRKRTADVVLIKAILLVISSLVVLGVYFSISYVLVLLFTAPALLFFSWKLYINQTDQNAIVNHRVAIIYMGMILISVLI